MDSLFSEIDAWQIWVIAGIILCILEIFTPGFFLMAIGAGCLIAALGSLILGLNWQIVLFILGSVIFFFASRKLMLPKQSESDEKFGMERLVGQTGAAIGTIKFDSGYVRIEGEKWPARTEGNMVIPDAAAVDVYDFSGNKLTVRVRKE